MNLIYDSHFHIIDPRFPLTKNNGFLPNTFLLEEYKVFMGKFNIHAGTVVSASYQGYDQTYLEYVLQELGSNFVGVTQLPYNVTEREILRLAKVGIKGVRLNIYNGLPFDHQRIEGFANRIYDIANWHIELHIDSRDLKELYPVLKKLPAVSIDHFGLKEEGFSWLLRLIEHGIKVKASGFGRLDFDPGKALKAIYSVNPVALMFGTDLPSTRVNIPFKEEDITLVYQALGDYAASKVLYSNAMDWYHKNGNDGLDIGVKSNSSML